MNREEVRLFKLLIERTDSEKDRKTLQLFDMVRKDRNGATSDTEQLVLALYGKDTATTRNNLYGLRNRLLKELKRSLNFQHWDMDNKHRAQNHLLLARQLRKQGRHRVARTLLERTLKEAEKHDLFQVQDMVLEELLGLASVDLSLDVADLIRRREAAAEKLRVVQDSQNAFAYLNQRLRKTNFVGDDQEIIRVMEEVRHKLQRYQSIFNSPRGRIRIFNITSQILLKNNAFHQLETFLKREYEYFESEKIFNRNTHRTKVNMVAWLMNATFKNFKFEESIQYCELFRETLEAYNRRFFNQFMPNYYLGLANNYSSLGEAQRALTLLQRVLKEEQQMLQGVTRIYLLMNLAITQYEQGHFTKTLKTLGRIYTTDGYDDLDALNQLLLSIFEIAVRIDTQDLEFAETRLEQVQRWFAKELKKHPEKQAFVKVLGLILEGEMFGRDPWLRPELKLFHARKTNFVPGADEIIDYQVWLQAYREKSTYGEVLRREILAIRKERLKA